MEFYKTHTNKDRKNEFKLFMAKVRRALKKCGDVYCDNLTLALSKYDYKEAKQVLKETGAFFYQEKGITLDFQFDSYIYIYIDENQ